MDPFNNPPARHPVIILTGDDEIAANETIVGVVASHTSAMIKPRRDEWIPIPFHPNGNCHTRLRKETVAVCNWVVAIPSGGYDEKDIGGDISKRLLLEILTKIREIQAAKTIAQSKSEDEEAD